MRRLSRQWLVKAFFGIVLLSAVFFVRASRVNAACTDAGYGVVSNLSITVDSANAGSGYRVWSRMQGPSANSTYLLQIDDTCYTVGGSGISSSSWVWTDRLDGSSKTISLSAGTHPIKLYGTANDVLLDRVIFTKSTTGACAPPTGTGDACVNEPEPDTTPPTVSITSPANNSTISTGSVVLQANASDVGGTVSKVEYYYGQNNKIGEASSAPYAVTWNTASLTNGSYSLTARAYDNSGNQGNTTVSTNVTIMNGQPNLKVSALSISPTSPNVGQTVTVTATIQNVGAVATPSGVVNTVGFSIGGNNLTPATTNAALAVNATRTLSTTWVATAGSHTITARVDSLNTIAESNENDNTLTLPVTVNSPDTTAPSVSITAPPANSTNLNGTVNISASATDTGGSGMQKVEFYIDDELRASVTSGASAVHTYAWDTTLFNNGGHKIGVRAYDKAGNSTNMISIQVSVTNNTPSTPIKGDTSPVGSSGYGVVDYSDLVVVLANYEKGGNKTREQGNVDNSDGLNIVNYRDLTAVLSGWTK